MFFITSHLMMLCYFIGNDVHAVHSNIIRLQVIELFGNSQLTDLLPVFYFGLYFRL